MSSAPILAGELADVGLTEVLDVTSLGRQTLRIELTTPDGFPVGQVLLKAGRIVSARAGGRSGQAALDVLMAADPQTRFRVFRETRAPGPTTMPVALVSDLVGGAPVSRPSGRMKIVRSVPPQSRVPVMQGSVDEFDVPTLLQTASLGRQYTEVKVVAEDGKPLGTVLMKGGMILRGPNADDDAAGGVLPLLNVPRRSRFEVSRIDVRLDPSVLEAEAMGSVAQVLFEAAKVGVNHHPAGPIRVLVMQGLVSEFDVPTLLQTVPLGRQLLLLEVVERGVPVGTAVMKAGMLVEAQAGGDDGLAGLKRLLRSPRHCQFRIFRLTGDAPAREPLGPIDQLLFKLLHTEETRPARSVARGDRLGREPVMQGSLSDVSLRTLLETLSTNRQHIEIELARTGNKLGELRLKAGRVLSAHAGGKEGVPAFRHLVALPGEASFAVHRRLDPIDGREPLGTVVDLLHAIDPSARTPIPVALPVRGNPATTAAFAPSPPLGVTAQAPSWQSQAPFPVIPPAPVAIDLRPRRTGQWVALGIAGAAVAAYVVFTSWPAPVPVVAPATSEPRAPIIAPAPEPRAPTPPPPIAVAPAAPPARAEAPAIAKPPPAARSSRSVAEAQRLLHELGYDVGPIDGVAGPRTRAATSAFQRDEGLPERGALDRDTASALRARAREQ